MSVEIAAIVAMSENHVIGHEGKLPWHIPEDLKHFKDVTMGKPVVMGRKTFDSIGKPLPGRTNLVLSRNDLKIFHKGADGKPGRIQYLKPIHPLQEALHLAKAIARQEGLPEIMIIGGGEIYRHTLALTSRLYLTVVHQTIGGDTFFPDIPPREWRLVERDDRDGYSFLTMAKI